MRTGRLVDYTAIVEAEEQPAAMALPVVMEACHVDVSETEELFRAGGNREALDLAKAVILVHQVTVDFGIQIHVTPQEKRLPSSGREPSFRLWMDSAVRASALSR